MNSEIRNVQILVKLLKQYGIKELVLSPGGSDIPIIHSLETDDFFHCYSVVDERNATYYAMGLAQEKKCPVAAICTSGTAVCNYLPGITEAFYQNVPIIAITADKNPYFQSQLETQKIEQTKIFDGVVKKSVNLPIIKCDDDEWLCNRLINEALLEISHHGMGPVHINIPVIGNNSEYITNELPNERVINFLEEPINDSEWLKIVEKLSQKEKIMIVVGQNINFTKEMENNMSNFFASYNCFYAIEHLSNLNCNGTINTYPITEISSLGKELLPDLVISIGNNLSAYKLKPFLRNHYKETENWLIDPSGKIRDAYKSLTKVFECSIEHFFEKTTKLVSNIKNNQNYYNLWKNLKEKIEIPELTFSNMYAAKKLAESIPDNSILHLAILNSTRLIQFFNLPKNVKVYSNVGALGIDGCLASFAGQAAATDKKAYLLIGDLSFFYGMNGAGLRSINKNVRIILINNTGGSEFHFFMGKEIIPTIDDYICAKHNHIAKGWVESLGYKYYSAKNKEEVDFAMEETTKDSDKPIFIEIFTDMENDANKTLEIYNKNRLAIASSKGGLSGAKDILSSKLTQKQKNAIKKVIKKIKK